MLSPDLSFIATSNLNSLSEDSLYADIDQESSFNHPQFVFSISFHHQPHPDPSRAVMEVSVPCSVATPSVAEQFKDQGVLPSTYFTPSGRRSDKGSSLIILECHFFHLLALRHSLCLLSKSL